MVPLLPPLQETFVTVALTAKIGGCVIVTVDGKVQPKPSLMVTEYVPIGKLLAVEVVCVGAVFHK